MLIGYDSHGSQGHAALACEVNASPDNSGSHAFHARLGFEALGDEVDAGGTSVRYYVLKL